MLWRTKSRKSYTLTIEDERYNLPVYIWIELEGDALRLCNRFTWNYHKFVNGEDVIYLNVLLLERLMRRLEIEFEVADDFRRGNINTK